MTRHTRWGVVTIAALLVACGGGSSGTTPRDPPPDTNTPGDATPQARTVTGTLSMSYHQRNGDVVEVPDDLTTTTVEALVPTGDGYRTIAGTGDAAGRFRVDEVPPGEFVLRVGDAYYVTSASDLDGAVEVFGRARAAAAPAGATITLDLSGFEPMAASDYVGLMSPDAGVIGDVPPVLDATTVTGSWAFADLFFRDAAIDGALGDRTLVLQMTSPAGYSALTRAAVTDAFALTSGAATLTATLAPLPVETLQADVHYLEFARAAGPAPTEDPGRVRSPPEQFAYDYEVAAMPQSIAFGYWADPVAYVRLSPRFEYGAPGQMSVTYGTLGAGWATYASFQARYADRYRTSAGGFETTLYRTATLIDSREAFAANPVVPRVSAPRDVRIDGAEFVRSLSGGSLTPRLSWAAPELGTPAWYELQLWELGYDGLRTTRARGPRFVTTGTSLRIPQGVLTPGVSYVFDLKAVSVQGIDRRVQLRRGAYPLADASTLSGIYQP